MSVKQNPPQSFDALSGLAHELDAPLKSLVKSSQKLLDDYKTRNFEYISYNDFKNIMKTLEQINIYSKRCSETTQKMIRLGKQQGPLSVQTCNINDVIRVVTNLLAPQIEKFKIKVSFNLNEHLPLIALGEVEAHQIINNVLINAIQAMPAGGRIKINTGLEGDMAVIDIEDQGVGITPEHLSKVFEPFFTTKERGIEKSAGLGLSVVYSLIHSAGGDIHIQSSLRKGTSVHIHLPVVKS